MPTLTNIEAEVERNYRHNFIVNFFDGTAFWFGASFFAYRTILPVYLANLTDSEFSIGLLSTIIATGWLLPQLFTANWTQRLPVKKVAPVKWGLFTERLPIFLLIPAVWLATVNTELAIIAFFILIAWHLVGAGVIAVGWQDMIAKIFPIDRRGKFFGLTNFGGTATGILGASAAAWLLDRYEFPYGYMLCFAAASILIFISWIFLAMTREPAVEPKEAPISEAEYWKRLPKILREDSNYRRYLISQIVITGGGIALGFLAVYAVQRWDLPDSQAGLFTTSMLLGQALSNLLFGWLSDRKGHKLILELSVLASVLSVGLAFVASQPGWFYAVFALVGVSAAGFMMSGIMIVFEFAHADIRPTYIGLNNTVIGVFSALMPLLGAWLIGAFGYRVLFGFAIVFGIVGLAMLRWWVQ
jgi:MFS family permease